MIVYYATTTFTKVTSDKTTQQIHKLLFKPGWPRCGSKY